MAVTPAIPVPSERGDGRIVNWVLLPGLFLAGLILLGGARDFAVGLAGATIGICTLIAPEVGLYVYCAWQGLDQMFIQEKEAFITPGKFFGPFILVAYLLNPQRVRQPVTTTMPIIAAAVAMGFFGLVTSIWAVQPLLSARFGGQILVQALLIVVAVHRMSERAQMGRALVFTVVGGVIVTAVMLAGGGATAERRAGLSEFVNPNSTALSLSLAVMSIPAAWLLVKNKLVRFGLVVAAPVIVIGLLLTGSRAQFLTVVLSPILALLTVRGAKISQRVVIPLGIGAVLAVSIYYAFQLGFVGGESRERLELLMERGVDVEGESRLYIWSTFWGLFLRHPWGYGYGNTAFALQAEKGGFIDVHSSPLGVLVDGGVVAFALFAGFLVVLFFRVRALRRGDLAIAAMMLYFSTVLSLLTRTVHFSKYFWIPVMFCVVLVELARREETSSAPGPSPPLPVTTEQLLRQLGPNDTVIYGPAR